MQKSPQQTPIDYLRINTLLLKTFYFLTLFLFVLISGDAQMNFHGTIIAADTKSPLRGASVFLSNTSVGTVSDAQGKFTLSAPTGKYDLVVSYVGYETQARTISAETPSELTITLNPKVEVLDDVVVGTFEKDGWKKWGTFFLENFIGTSEGAADCKIKNQDAIKFRRTKKDNKIIAIALDQLVIENRSLGYVIKYQLEGFEYNFDTRYLSYQGYPLFTEMQGNAAKQRRWKARRDDAYYGSMMEFMRAVYRNKINETGYEVRRLVKRPNTEKERVREIYRNRARLQQARLLDKYDPASDSMTYYEKVLRQPDQLLDFSKNIISGDSIAYGIDSVTAGMEFPNFLHVTYKKAQAPRKYQQMNPQNPRMMSELNLITEGPLEIQSSGNYFPPLKLMSSGYWAWSEKVGTLLPYDYKPYEIRQ